MNELERQQVRGGRQAVEAYRLAHRELHAAGWHRGIADGHKTLLDNLLAELEKQGFASVRLFASASHELNIEELGIASKAEFESKATEEQRQLLERMWQ